MMGAPRKWALAGIAATAVLPLQAFAAEAAADATEPPTSIAQLLQRSQSPIVEQSSPVTEDDFILVDVTTGKFKVGEGLGAYASRSGVYVPLGELSRLLDLAVAVDAPHGLAEGFVIRQTRTLKIDLVKRTATVSGNVIALTAGQAFARNNDIFVRVDLLQKLIPATFDLNARDLELSIIPKEPFPFQERLDRESRRQLLNGGLDETVMHVRTPYAAFTPPAVELNLAFAGGNNDPKHTERYDIRAAGDFAYSDLQLFGGSDDHGRLNNARVLIERKDPLGKETGIPGMTRISIGDTYTPNLQLGPASTGGRGIFMTSAPLEQASVFDTIDIRGEQPVGWEVELYVNEILITAQPEPINGRYEFKGVRLAYGLNTIRVVLYGPRGERREDVRRMNVGAALLAKGKSSFTFGAVQQNQSVIRFGQSSVSGPSIGGGDWRIAADLAYGLTKNATANVGLATYTPSTGESRSLVKAGVSTSLMSYATQIEAAVDDQGARAILLGMAGRIGNASVVAQHTEYHGDFADEAQTLVADPVRNTTLNITATANAPGIGTLPVNFRVGRLETENDTRLTAGFQTSKPFGRYLASTSLDYQSLKTAGSSFDQLNGALDVSTLFGKGWQVRTGLNYTLVPDVRATSLAFAADRQINEKQALRFGVNHAFGAADQTNYQVGSTWRLDKADVSLVASYVDRTDEFRIGLNLSTGFGYDPMKRRYAVTGPGVAAGGSMEIHAFVDENGDGVPNPGERPIPGIKVAGGRREQVTDAEGHATITGLGDGAAARVHLDTEKIDDPYLVSPPTAVEIVPRPGRMAVVNYPLTQTGEAEIKIVFVTPGQPGRGLSALSVQLVDAKGAVAAEGRTEFDGTWFVEKLKPGTYQLRLDPTQGANSKLALKAPVTLTIKPKGGFAGRISGEVVSASKP